MLIPIRTLTKSIGKYRNKDKSMTEQQGTYRTRRLHLGIREKHLKIHWVISSVCLNKRTINTRQW